MCGKLGRASSLKAITNNQVQNKTKIAIKICHERGVYKWDENITKI